MSKKCRCLTHILMYLTWVPFYDRSTSESLIHNIELACILFLGTTNTDVGHGYVTTRVSCGLKVLRYECNKDIAVKDCYLVAWCEAGSPSGPCMLRVCISFSASFLCHSNIQKAWPLYHSIFFNVGPDLVWFDLLALCQKT